MNDAPQEKRPQQQRSDAGRKAMGKRRSLPVPPPPPPKKFADPQTQESPYAFTIRTPKRDTFFFKLDNKGHPIKLGDGTYGIVYEVHDSRNRMYAAKLLYQDQETDRSRERFQAEMRSAQLIYELIDQHEGDRNDFAGVIETEGGTDQFHSSRAYSTLQEILEPLRVSNYVLVMPKYEKTLKQLLEEERPEYYTLSEFNVTVNEYFPSGTPIVASAELENQIHSKIELLNPGSKDDERKEIVQELRDAMYPVTGYEILRRMNFDERINHMHPYIYSVAEGLKTLHQVNLLHLDLKPANIFVRKKGNKIETVIGDLGFLDEVNRQFTDFSYKPYLDKTNQPSLPLGTRHYRSPEQKDFFDIADVEVKVGSDIELVIKDPKFNDTIIEELDVVSFSQYKQDFEIAEVRSKKVGDNHSYFIRLDKGMQDDVHMVRSDKRTQVYFYKRQRHRTDLFGFGALIFELLTCGKSPERFYEAIRAYDTDGHDVESIMDLYQQISNFQSAEPGLVQIFAPFKLHEASSTYAPPEIVRLILKCMLYKADNRFFHPDKEADNPGVTMRQVIAELEDLYYSSSSRFEKLELVTQNSLYETIPRGASTSSQSATDFDSDLKALIQLKKQDFPKRLCQGIQKLEKLINLIQTYATSEITYFFELTPSNIIQDKSGVLGARYTVYEDQRFYLDDVAKDSLYTKINRGVGNPYVPTFLNFIRRPIRLEGVRYNINRTPATLDCTAFQFSDISPYGSMVQENDWILVKTQGKSYLFAVNAVNSTPLAQDSWALRLSIPVDDEEEWNAYESVFKNNGEPIDAIFYKHLAPTQYYLNMLGIYIYHLFFVGLDGNTPDKPQLENALRSFSIDLIEKVKISAPSGLGPSHQPTQTIPKRTKKSGGGLFGLSKKEKPIQSPTPVVNPKEMLIREIVLTLTWMYLKLVFVESQNSYYSEKETLEEMMIAVRSSLRKLKDQVAQFVGCDVVELDQMSPKLAKKLPQLSSQFGVGPSSVLLSFNELMSELIHISSGAERNYIKNIF